MVTVHSNAHIRPCSSESPISPIMEEDVDSSVGGLVPSRPGMLPNRYNRSDEAPGELRNVASLFVKSC